MRNTLIVWGIVLLVIFGSVFAIYKIAKAPSLDGGGGDIPAVSESDQTRGPRDAKVVVVEYSDFQCPACGAFFPQIEELNEELDGEILFIYRHFPLPQHQNAVDAAIAAEAAGKQGKFWEMHDALFINQNEWSEAKNVGELFAKYAGSIGLDAEVFAKDSKAVLAKDKVSSDLVGGTRARVNSTPTFYLNGKKLIGFNSYDEFKNLIREAVRNNP